MQNDIIEEIFKSAKNAYMIREQDEQPAKDLAELVLQSKNTAVRASEEYAFYKEFLIRELSIPSPKVVGKTYNGYTISMKLPNIVPKNPQYTLELIINDLNNGNFSNYNFSKYNLSIWKYVHKDAYLEINISENITSVLC
jgi:hypothetical protein